MGQILTEQQNEQLVEALKSGSKAAFDEIYEMFWDRLLVFAFNILHDQQASEDIVQEVFVDLWQRRKHALITHIRGFLFQAVKFQVVKHIRRKGNLQKYFQDFESRHYVLEEQPMEAEELAAAINESLESLPRRCREIFYLSRFEYKSNAEIAESLGLSNQTVKNQISKALQHLKQHLGDTAVLAVIFLC